MLYWSSLCVRFHKVKNLQEYKKKVSQLEKELEVDDNEALVISSNFISCNYKILDEKEVQKGTTPPQRKLDLNN